MPRRTAASWTLVVAAAITAMAALGLEGDVFAGFQAGARDAYFPSSALDPRVVVVGIDARAIAETGRPWPWPRDVQAALLRKIAAPAPRLVVVDVVYSPQTDGDDELAAAMRSAGNVVVAGAAELTRARGKRLLVARTFTSPVPAVAVAAADVGHANILPDSGDGVVRSLPILAENPDGEMIPSLTLAAVTQLDQSPDVITFRPHGIQVGTRYVPTGRSGLLELNYAAALSPHAGGNQYVSAADVLADRTGDRLAGKVVMIGLTDPTFGDQHLIPGSKQAGVSGVFVHANALNTVLTGSYLSPASRVEALATVFGVTLLAAGLVLITRLWLAAIGVTALGVSWVVLAFARFDQGHVVDLVYPAISVVLAAVVALALRYLAEARQRRQVTSLLSQYVPMSVARQLVDRRRAAGLPEGSITFLFTDVVGSTRAWDAWPQAMSQAMRRHDALLEQAVDEAGGAMVRPRGEGDSRFGVFVRPVDAASAAADIHRRLMAERWDTPEPIQLRMALHTGESELREGDYYGSPVNRCARIRSLAEPGQNPSVRGHGRCGSARAAGRRSAP